MNLEDFEPGQDVEILSTNGTHRVTGHGVVYRVTASGVVVTRSNGKRLIAHPTLLRLTGGHA